MKLFSRPSLSPRWLSLAAAVVLSVPVLASPVSGASHPAYFYGFLPWTYTNPLELNTPLGPATSCPDPALISQRKRFGNEWFLYCTGDPLNGSDRNVSGNLQNHLIPMYRSRDLIHWSYIGDAFKTTPSWVGTATDQLWAPAVKHFNGKYYMYFTAPQTKAGGSAVGVATSDNPAGPWKDSGIPVVPPENNPFNGAPGRAVIDPDVVQGEDGQRYISYGSFPGGISIRKLSASGLQSDIASEKQLAVDNYVEGGSYFRHGDYYYLFVSASTCCDGPLSGYGVRVGRAKTPEGPFFDQNGVALNTFAPGGSVAMEANGNKWVGPGGNVVFTDAHGHDYILYHAVDRFSPYFKGTPGFTRRPALIDRVDWVDGWPQVRAGRWASDSKQPAPAAQPWQFTSYLHQRLVADVEPGRSMTALSDEFNGGKLSPQWHFIHPAADNTYKLVGGAYQVVTHGADENGSPQLVSILGEEAPANGDWMVETKVTSGVPFDNSCCYNFAQPALFIYFDDQNSIKLDVAPIFDTRQSEFGRQVGPVAAGYPTYNHQVVGPVGKTTWLRIVMQRAGPDAQNYTAYSSPDGEIWTRGGTWTHATGEAGGAPPQIGISAQNSAGFTMDFDYVRVSRLKH